MLLEVVLSAHPAQRFRPKQPQVVVGGPQAIDWPLPSYMKQHDLLGASQRDVLPINEAFAKSVDRAPPTLARGGCKWYRISLAGRGRTLYPSLIAGFVVAAVCICIQIA